MLIDKELPVSGSHVTDNFFNSMVTVHIKPTAPHHTTVLAASVKKIQLPVLLHTLFLLHYRKPDQRWNPGQKWMFYPIYFCAGVIWNDFHDNFCFPPKIEYKWAIGTTRKFLISCFKKPGNFSPIIFRKFSKFFQNLWKSFLKICWKFR